MKLIFLSKKQKNILRSYFEIIVNRIFSLPTFRRPLPNNPFGNKILASKKKYLELFQKAKKTDDKDIRNYENQKGAAINIEWLDDLALHTQVCMKNSEINYHHGRILYTELSSYLKEYKSNKNNSELRIFETGTARGFSSLCMAKSLLDNEVNGSIITLDCIPHNKKIYWNAIDDHNGPRTRAELLKKWDKELEKVIFIQGWTHEVIKNIGIKRINFAFLDAHHSKKDVLFEYKFVSERQNKGDIIIFDDVTTDLFPGVCAALKDIEYENNYRVIYLESSKNRRYAIAKRII